MNQRKIENIITTQDLQKIETVFDAVIVYKKLIEQGKLSCNFSSLKTALMRYTAPAWGFNPPPKEKNLSIDCLDFLKTIPLSRLNGATKDQEEYFDLIKADKDCRRQNRHHLKKFVDWVEEQGWLISIDPHTKLPKGYRYIRPAGKRKPDAHRINTTGKKRIKPFAIGTSPNEIYYDASLGKTIIGNLELTKDIEDYLNFERSRGRTSEDSLQEDVEYIRIYLGYLHRVKGTPISELRLTSIIPHIRLRYSIDDFLIDKENNPVDTIKAYQDFSITEIMTKQREKKIAEDVSSQFDEYIQWWDKQYTEIGSPPTRKSTKKIFFKTMLSVGRFVYRDERETDEDTKFESVKIVWRIYLKLKNTKIDLKEAKKTIQNRCVPLPIAFKVFEMQRERTNYHWSSKPSKSCKNNTRYVKRSLQAIAEDFQRTVVLGLMLLIPTDRQQTYRNLIFGETLLKGMIVEHGFGKVKCIPAATMENPKEAKYWLNLKDFKTAGTHGEFWYPVPNTRFKDGRYFYEYIDAWLFGFEDKNGTWTEHFYKGENKNWQGYISPEGIKGGWRNYFNPSHDYIFLRTRSLQPFNVSRFSSYIEQIFGKFTCDLLEEPVPVTPHSIRHMQATYTENNMNLTNEQKESLAYCQHHTKKVREQFYSHLENMRKIAPAVEVMNQVNAQCLV